MTREHDLRLAIEAVLDLLDGALEAEYPGDWRAFVSQARDCLIRETAKEGEHARD